MPDVHEGGCACGAVRYRALGQPVSAGMPLQDGDVAISRGRLMLCEHRSAGTFDDPGWLRIDRHICRRGKQ
jgi:hypothetical protein